MNDVYMLYVIEQITGNFLFGIFRAKLSNDAYAEDVSNTNSKI